MSQSEHLVTRLPSDIGGLPADPISRTDHELAPWEKRCHALADVLDFHKIINTEEKRRGVEALGTEMIGKLTYYERWIVAFSNILFQKGVLTPEDLALKMGQVEARGLKAAGAIAAGALLVASPPASAQSAASFRGAAPVVPLMSEAPARLIVDAPLAAPLMRGRVVIQYRTENLHIVPVFGPAALAVSPRIGHLHLTVDDLPWHWLDASGEPLTVTGLPPGPHKIRIQLENANHMVLDTQMVNFVVPKVDEPGYGQ